ncbi:MAG: phosphoenolpyruvate--protein phosphotransferase, partial [Alphaproteobacteria bacterium HGW-Alphaproteobacteria-16]
PDGTSVILDADAGWIDPAPAAATIDWCRTEMAERRSAHAIALAHSVAPARLADGTRLEVFANLASVGDAKLAVENGAEGCGLLRTEFIFAEASKAPDEQSQRQIYADIAAALDGRPMIVRTIDIGGDKPVEYLPFPHEANPALGQRGIRFALQMPDILRTQLRAILQGVPRAQLRIMLPMIVEVAEIQAVRAMLDAECASLGIAPGVELGIMVETPAAVLIADQLAAHADFLSIGSNDLAQYVLAMDRGNAALVSRVDAYHPAVLQAVALTGQAAVRHHRWLGLCGGLASDPKGAPLLVGLGCHELSAVPRAIPEIKQVLARWTHGECIRLAERALALESAEAVRNLLAEEVR